MWPWHFKLLGFDFVFVGQFQLVRSKPKTNYTSSKGQNTALEQFCTMSQCMLWVCVLIGVGQVCISSVQYSSRRYVFQHTKHVMFVAVNLRSCYWMQKAFTREKGTEKCKSSFPQNWSDTESTLAKKQLYHFRLCNQEVREGGSEGGSEWSPAGQRSLQATLFSTCVVSSSLPTNTTPILASTVGVKMALILEEVPLIANCLLSLG